MDRTEKQPTMPHQLILQERQQAEISGVSDVDSFDETTVIAYTSLGELNIRGRDLHIKRLDLECGVLSIEGTICSLEYTDNRKNVGVLGRLFR